MDKNFEDWKRWYIWNSWYMVDMKPSRTMWDSWAHKPFCAPHFLFLGNKLQPSCSNSCKAGEEWGAETRGSSQETVVQPWGRVLVPPRSLYITMLLSSSVEPNPQQMKSVMKHSSFQKGGGPPEPFPEPIGAVATGLHHSHGNSGSEPSLQPTP